MPMTVLLEHGGASAMALILLVLHRKCLGKCSLAVTDAAPADLPVPDPAVMWVHSLLHEVLSEAKFSSLSSLRQERMADGAANNDVGFAKAIKTMLLLVAHRAGLRA